MPVENTVVIGAGPAGLAAAGHLSLLGLPPLVLEADIPGGLLLNAGSVRNYPGVPRGISGRDLIALFPLPERLHRERVTGVSRREDGVYEVSWNQGRVESLTVIVASGTLPVEIPLPGVERSRIFHEARKVPRVGIGSAAVIGGGDAALDYALSLSERMPVNVYARNGFGKAAPHLLKQAGSCEAICLIPFHGEFSRFAEDIVVVACGRKRNVGFVAGDLLCSPPEDGTLHFCGDCANGIFRQTAIAVGNGVRAAMGSALYIRSGERTE